SLEIVDPHDHAAGRERRDRRRRDDEQQFRTQRAEAEHHCLPERRTTRSATLSISAFKLNRPRCTAGCDTSKRTLSRTITKLTMLPRSSAPSSSVTVST